MSFIPTTRDTDLIRTSNDWCLLVCVTSLDTHVIGIGNCGIRHVTVPIATRILIANVRHIGLSNICVINLVYFNMQV